MNKNDTIINYCKLNLNLNENKKKNYFKMLINTIIFFK